MPLFHTALCHYQFEAIHPFLDGNGRIGRLLITLLMIQQELLPSPLLYLRAYFEVTREQYYSSLFNVSSKGCWTEWLSYFLAGVAAQAQDALSRAESREQRAQSTQRGNEGKIGLSVKRYCNSLFH